MLLYDAQGSTCCCDQVGGAKINSKTWFSDELVYGYLQISFVALGTSEIAAVYIERPLISDVWALPDPYNTILHGYPFNANRPMMHGEAGGAPNGGMKKNT